MVGRSQEVRHRILIPAFPGSNPGAPANLINRIIRRNFAMRRPWVSPGYHATQIGRDRQMRLSFVQTARLRRFRRLDFDL
jgi:hypothetical protein